MERFNASKALELIERERVTVFCAVSTQFVLMLNDPDLDRYDLSFAAGHVHRRRDDPV